MFLMTKEEARALAENIVSRLDRYGALVDQPPGYPYRPKSFYVRLVEKELLKDLTIKLKKKP